MHSCDGSITLSEGDQDTLKVSGETKRSEENTSAPSIMWYRVVECLSVHHPSNFHGNSSVSHLQ